MSDESGALAAALAAMRDQPEEAPVGFPDRLHATLRRELRWRTPVRRIARDPRAQYAAASLGGVLVGAAAIALLWRRTRRRAAAA